MFKKTKNKQALGRIGRVEREQRYNRIIRYTTFSIVGLVVAIALGGFLYNSVYLPSQPIATVDGEEILTSEFQTRVKMDRVQLVNQYNSYLEVAQQITDPNQQQQYLLVLAQLEAQLEPETMGQAIIDQMIDEKFIVEEAESRGITVTDEEVDIFFNSIFGYYPEGIPTDFPSPTSLPTSTLSPEQLALITPTPGEESGEDTSGELPEQPEPTSVTEEEYDTNISEYLDNMGAYGVDEAFLKELIRVQLYRDKLNADLAKGITPPTEEQVWARHILLDDLEIAEDLLQQLEDGGDFGDLAREFSTGPTGVNGGDLGWFGRGQMVAEFEEAAFGGEVGEIVGPVETQFGFHLIQIVGKEERPGTADQLNQLVSAVLSDIINRYREEAEIVYADNYLNRTPTEPDIVHFANQQ